MAVLRAIGYIVAILIIIAGIALFPLGIVLIIGGIIMIWALRKGGQVSNMQKDLKAIKKIEEENQKLKLEKMKKDALDKRDDNEESF